MTPRSAILDLLRERGPGKTICPSEAARRLDPESWRGRMDEVRGAGRALASQGTIRVLQKGETVDPAEATGPIRYALGDSQ